MVEKAKIAIGFDTIVDEDFGLISLIFNEYLDPSVFDISKFQRSVPEILQDLYAREEVNPLLSFTRDDCKEDVDALYNEFISTKYTDILDKSIGTNMQNYINVLNSTSEYMLMVFCYNEVQYNFINGLDEFGFAKKIMFSDLDNLLTTNQFYFKYITQSYPIKDLVGANMYYSTIGPNLNAEKDDLKATEEMELIKKKNYVKLFSLYDFDRIKIINSSKGEVYNDLLRYNQ